MAERNFNRNTDPEMRRRLGRFFQSGRIRKKMTQEQLAEALGLTKKSVSFIENGKTYPSPENIFRMTKLLDLSLDEFVFGYAHMGQNSAVPELNEALGKLNPEAQECLVRVLFEICHIAEA